VRLSIPVLLLLGGCSKAVKGEGFRAQVPTATDAALTGRFEGSSGESCALVTPDQREVRLRGDGFRLDLVEPAGRPDDRTLAAVVQGERFVLDRPGTDSTLVLETPGGRAIGSLRATLVHETAGTEIDGRPAPVRELSLEVSFNLQPCL
jgi:hypothetical protein